MRIADRLGGNAVPLTFGSGQGAVVADDDGTEYVDLICGHGPIVLGHAQSEHAIRMNELCTGPTVYPSFATVQHRYLREAFPAETADWCASFYKSSSEAVSACMRMAGLQSGSFGLVRSGYLGWMDGQYDPAVRWQEPASSPLRRRSGLKTALETFIGGRPGWSDGNLDTLEQLVEPSHIKAFVFDSYQAALIGDEILLEAIQRCRHYGLLVIADETKTAGRIGPLGWLYERGVVADFLILGKAIANGFPLSLVVMPEFDAASYTASRASGTYSKDALAAASALATWELLMAGGGYAKLAQVATDIASVANHAFERSGMPAGVLRWDPTFGGGIIQALWGAHILGCKEEREALVQELFRNGIIVADGQPMYVGLSHAEIERSSFGESIAAATVSWLRMFPDLVA